MASKDTPKTIILSNAFQIQREAAAGVAIRPGMLVELNAAGAVIPHATAGAGQEGAVAVAIENDLTGRGIDDNYAIGERVRYQFLNDGAKFFGIIAASQNIAFDDALSSNADGTLKEAAATDMVVGYARTVVVTGVGVTARCVVEVAKARGIA
jgi:hypothetical protein